MSDLPDLSPAERQFVFQLEWWLAHDRTRDSIPANFIHQDDVKEEIISLGLPWAATVARCVALGFLASEYPDRRGGRALTGYYKILGGVINVARRLRADRLKKPDATDDDAKESPVAALLDETQNRMVAIAQDGSLTTDEKMRRIGRLIPKEVVGWRSERWADVLGVSAQAVRKTPVWKELKKLPTEFDG